MSSCSIDSLGHCPSHRSCLQRFSRVSPLASPVIYGADFISSPHSIFEADTSGFVLFWQNIVGIGIPSAWFINHTLSSSLLSHASPSHPIHIPYPRPYHHQPLHPEQSKFSSSPAVSSPHWKPPDAEPQPHPSNTPPTIKPDPLEKGVAYSPIRTKKHANSNTGWIPNTKYSVQRA